MANFNNSVKLEGRLVDAPRVFDNQDGSKSVRFRLAVQRNFKNAQGQYETDFIDARAFISKDAKSEGVYKEGILRKGLLVAISAELRSSVYQKDGKDVYEQYVHANEVQIKESKAVADAREAK